MGLTSIHWRESWKYGERAFRYCNHDVGHAIGTARIAAATLGWNMALLDGVSQDTVATLLGADRAQDFIEAEQEHADGLAVVWPSGDVNAACPLYLDSEIVQQLVATTWQGKANRLSRENPVPWEIIDEVAEASWKTSHDHISVAVPSSGTTHDSRFTTLAPLQASLFGNAGALCPSMGRHSFQPAHSFRY